MMLKKSFKYTILGCMLWMIFSINIMAQGISLSAGDQNQVGGYVELTETEAGMFQKGDLVFTIDSEEAGIYLDDVKVETTGNIKVSKTKVSEGKHGKVTLTISRRSSEASKIILSEFVISTDRTVPEGSYDLKIGGTALTRNKSSKEKDNEIKVAGFIKVATPNTQDIASSGIAKGTSTFKINEKQYLENDKVVDMDAAAYIEGNGRIMIPLRYAAKAFGMKDKDIIFSAEQVTLMAGERTIALKNGSNKAIFNHTVIDMEAPLIIKEGRAYIPAGQIANLLGIKTTWDQNTKTVTFINE